MLGNQNHSDAFKQNARPARGRRKSSFILQKEKQREPTREEWKLKADKIGEGEAINLCFLPEKWTKTQACKPQFNRTVRAERKMRSAGLGEAGLAEL